MRSAVDNYNNICRIYAKGFLDSNFNQVEMDKISVFTKFAQNSHTLKNRNFYL